MGTEIILYFKLIKMIELNKFIKDKLHLRIYNVGDKQGYKWTLYRIFTNYKIEKLGNHFFVGNLKKSKPYDTIFGIKPKDYGFKITTKNNFFYTLIK